MFYQEEEINRILICFVCENKMVDPRILPCNNSLCYRCVEIIADTEKKRIKCKLCGKTHDIPEDGFTINLVAKNLLDIKAREVSQPKQIKEFKNLIDSMEKMKESIEQTLKAGDAKIRDHCDKSRNQVQISIEEAHTELDEIHKYFMSDIDQHEEICQEKLKSIQQQENSYFKEILTKSSVFILASIQLLKQFNIEETELAKNLGLAHRFFKLLESTKDKLEKLVFNDCLLKFDKTQFGASSIGKISKQKMELYFLDNVENIRELNLGDRQTLDLQPFKSNNYILLNKINNSLNAVCTDKTGNVLFEKNLTRSMNVEEIVSASIHVSKCKNNFIFLYSVEKHYEKEMNVFKLRSYDQNFNLLAKRRIFFEPCDVKLHGKNFFVLGNSEDDAFCTLDMFNSNLELVESFGQGDPQLPFYFATDQKHGLCISDRYYIVREDREWEDEEGEQKIKIINRESGLVETTIILYEKLDGLQIYLDKFILLFNADSGLLKTYDFRGNLVNEIILDERVKNSIFSILNKELCFANDGKYLII